LQDEISPARLLVAYARRSRIVSVKGGLIGGRSFTADEIGRVAELPGREQLLATVVGGLQAPLAQTLAVLQAPLRQIAGLSQALLEKKQNQTETPVA
jgi:large subunit ribosomal protein L10